MSHTKSVAKHSTGSFTLVSEEVLTLELRKNSSLVEGLEKRVAKQLKERMMQGPHFSPEEIADVTLRSTRLFPKEYSLTESQYQSFGVLCRLSRCGFVSRPDPRSHRKHIGPWIDRVKRVLFRILDARYAERFDALEQFNSWLVAEQARLSRELASSDKNSDDA